jgi:hypothetical protein
MANLRDFRRSVAALKKQGLLGKSKIDARSVRPENKVAGKRLDTLVKKFDDVVSGKATAVKVSPAELKRFRKAGFETAQGRVLVPHSKSETARKQGEAIAIKNKTGVERVQIPVEFHNLRSYLTDLKKNAPLINRMKRRNEYFGIRFYGGQRATFYSDIESLIDDLERYDSISTVQGPAKQNEVYRNLEILRISHTGAQKIERSLLERKRVMSKAYNKAHAKRVRERLKGKSTAIQQRYRDNAAKRMKAYRQRLKRNKSAYVSYLKASNKRAAKSRKNQAKKKAAKKRAASRRKRK